MVINTRRLLDGPRQLSVTVTDLLASGIRAG